KSDKPQAPVFGLSLEPSTDESREPWDTKAELLRLYATLAATHNLQLAWLIDHQPDYVAGLNDSWFTPNMLAVGWPLGQESFLAQVKNDVVNFASDVVSVNAIGAWDVPGDPMKRADWSRAKTMHGAVRTVRDFMRGY